VKTLTPISAKADRQDELERVVHVNNSPIGFHLASQASSCSVPLNDGIGEECEYKGEGDDEESECGVRHDGGRVYEEGKDWFGFTGNSNLMHVT
jgi:hypothetical protein